LTLAAAGLGTSVALVVFFDFFVPSELPRALGETLGYLVVFVPLMAAVLLATYRWGQHSLAKDFGLAATWSDLLLGVAFGLVLRVCGMWLEVIIYGIRLGGGATLIPRSDAVLWILLAVLAPIIVAPVIEELFFRGLLLRGLRAWGTGRGLTGRMSTALAVGVSTVLFVLVHLLGAHSPKNALIIGIMTAGVGGAAALLAVRTGRLGPGLALHVTYNACVLIPALLA